MTFSQKQQDLQLVIQGLEEALEDVIDDNLRLKNTNRILRAVNSGLRSKLAIAHKNDEAFVSACQWDDEIDAHAAQIDSESDATGYAPIFCEPWDEEKQDYPAAFREQWDIT
jgi:hypothetical protein